MSVQICVSGHFGKDTNTLWNSRFMSEIGPNKDENYPLNGQKRLCFLKTYYDDFEDALNFEKNVKYHYDFIGDKLIIGKFCMIAPGVTFIMNGANHQLNGITTYPFSLFGHGWERVMPTIADLPIKGDTVIGNDVWIGSNVTIMQEYIPVMEL